MRSPKQPSRRAYTPWAQTLALTLAISTATAGTPMATLDDLRWERRLVIAFGNATSSEMASLDRQLERLAAEIADRDVDVYRVDNTSVTPLTSVTQALGAERSERLLSARASPDATFEMILIGKDGGRKEISTDADDLQRFLDAIDRMPMRRAESAGQQQQ